MDGYICMAVCEIFFSEGKCIKNKLWLPSHTWITVHQLLHFGRGECSVPTQANSTGEQNHHHTNPAGLHGKPGVQRAHKIHSGLGKITTKKLPLITNAQAWFCTAPFLGNTHFRTLSKNILKLSCFSANPHTSKDSVKHRYCQSHIHKSHVTIQHLKYKLYICKQISSLKQLAALILDGNSMFLFAEHQQRSQSRLLKNLKGWWKWFYHYLIIIIRMITKV